MHFRSLSSMLSVKMKHGNVYDENRLKFMSERRLESVTHNYFHCYSN